jgi:hypothetical protein
MSSSSYRLVKKSFSFSSHIDSKHFAFGTSPQAQGQVTIVVISLERLKKKIDLFPELKISIYALVWQKILPHLACAR